MEVNNEKIAPFFIEKDVFGFEKEILCEYERETINFDNNDYTKDAYSPKISLIKQIVGFLAIIFFFFFPMQIIFPSYEHIICRNGCLGGIDLNIFEIIYIQFVQNILNFITN